MGPSGRTYVSTDPGAPPLPHPRLRLPALAAARWAVSLSILALCAPAGRTQGRVEGTLGHRWPDRSEPTLYRYEVAPDSAGGAITIQEGTEPGGSSITLPRLVLRTLAQRVERHAPMPDRSERAYAEIAMDRSELMVGFERRLSLALVGLGGALLGVLALGLAVRRERRRRSVLVEARRREVESREAERLRLARELHDGPVQLLHLAGMNLGAANGTQASDARADVAEAVRELRAIAEGLRPPALGPFGLAPALEDLAARFGEQHPTIDLEVELDDDAGRLGEAARLALFRVAQEALSNAAAHASPRSVSLRLSITARGVELVVADDGRGAASTDTVSLGRRGHFGLLGMRERAELLGGTLEVTSPPGRGTRVQLRVPLSAQNRETSAQPA